MRRLRNIEYTLYYYIFDILSIYVDDVDLIKIDNNIFKFPFADVNFLRPLDIYVNNEKIDNYIVNFNNNFVIINTNQDILSCKANYYYVPIKVTPAFPDMLNEFIDIPSVAIEYVETYYKPLEIGTSQKRIDIHQFSIAIFAGNTAEKYDISEKIIFNLFDKTIPLIDYLSAFPLTPDGFLNNNFDKEKQIVGYLEFDNILQKSFRSEKIGDIELNVMVIDFTVIDYII